MLKTRGPNGADALDVQAPVKLVVMGARGAGKSSLLTRYVRNEFYDFCEPCAMRSPGQCGPVHREEGVGIQFDLWEQPPQFTGAIGPPSFFRGTEAAVVVHDVTKQSTARALRCIAYLRRRCGPGVVIALATTKGDLMTDADDDGLVEEAKRQGIMHFLTSALSGQNVHAMFSEIAKRVLDGHPQVVRARQARRQWARVLVASTHASQKVGSCRPLRQFFGTYPGLAKLVGGIMIRFFLASECFPEADTGKGNRCLIM